MTSSAPASTGLCLLVVGDGDFSGSLAIFRAYRPHIQRLVATSLVSCRDELFVLYPRAHAILKDLEGQDSTTILFGVDATKLHVDSRLKTYGSFDYIIFQHPHIGYQERCDIPPATATPADISNGASTNCGKLPKHAMLLATQHSSLLAHYLYSSRELIHQSHPGDKRLLSRIHLCLCAGQSKSWDLGKHLRRLGLEYAGRPTFASKPLWSHLEASTPTSSSSTIENKDHDYWLSWYGYQHQATIPWTTQLSNVVNSHHQFFRLRQWTDPSTSLDQATNDNMRKSIICQICLQEQCRYNATRIQDRVGVQASE
jgi:hypothetical protein